MSRTSTSKLARVGVVAVTLAMALSVAGPAAAAPQSAGWVSTWGHVAQWWSLLWGRSVRTWTAASEAAPKVSNVEPGDTQQLDDEPEASPSDGEQPPDGDTELRPHLDPDG